MFLAYYQKENERYPELLNQNLSKEEVVELTEKVIKEFFKVPAIPVYFSDTKNHPRRRHRSSRSYYNPRLGLISYGTGMLNPLTVIHEVGHYIHDFRFKEQLRNWKATKTGPVPNRGRWHGKLHKSLVDEAAQWLKMELSTLALVKAPEPAPAPVPAPVKASDPIEAFMASLPDLHVCPCCKTEKHKTAFGARVMKKDAAGKPVSIRRQSYCRECR